MLRDYDARECHMARALSVPLSAGPAVPTLSRRSDRRQLLHPDPAVAPRRLIPLPSRGRSARQMQRLRGSAGSSIHTEEHETYVREEPPTPGQSEPLPQSVTGQKPPAPRGMTGQKPPVPRGMTGQKPPVPWGMTGQKLPVPRGMTGQKPPVPRGMTGHKPPVPLEHD